jgi:hypothetical protein
MRAHDQGLSASEYDSSDVNSNENTGPRHQQAVLSTDRIRSAFAYHGEAFTGGHISARCLPKHLASFETSHQTVRSEMLS